MTLSSGSRLGPFEIAAKIGEGGMGEVYRATDTKLKRDVAIKVLPEAFTEDGDRLARFEREAQTLAQLHHPNIASIFGLEESGGVRALVMELVEGQTLDERIQDGAIPLDETLAIARQIAEALEEAHDKGIIHRDLKPANVKLTADGQVKVLDFGLAKAMDPKGDAVSQLSKSPTLMNSPTLTAAGTKLGVILGTAAYMSPEQARGRPVDKRADIWAFGVVVFEMLAGGRLFTSETLSDTLAAILRDEIDWQRLPSETPVALRRLLRSCLERDPRNRLHDIADARIALDDVTSGVDPDSTFSATQAKSSRNRAFGWLPAVLVAGAAVGGAAVWLLHGPSRTPPLATRSALAIPDGWTLATAEFPQIAISRDGRLQVMVAADASGATRLLLRTGDEFEPRPLPDTERAVSPFFSPDGAWIAFFRDGALFKIPVMGGPPVRLAGIGLRTRGGTWSRDGFIYFTPDATVGLSRISENGGKVEPVTRLDETRNERTHRWPDALADGSAVLFTCDDSASTEYYDDARIEAVRPTTGERKVLVEGSSQARFLPPDHLVFARGGDLFEIRFDPRTLAPRGSPVQVAQGVATDVGSGAVEFAGSDEGAALWVPGGLKVSYNELWVDRHGIETPVPLPDAPYNELALSQDGKRVAFTGGPGGIADLWVADLERGSLTRLTTGRFTMRPVWTPDGSRVVYTTQPQAGGVRTWQIAWKSADGSREAEVLVESARGMNPSGFTPDGRTLIYDSIDAPGARRNLWLLPLDKPREARLLIGDAFMKDGGVVSPDGRWLAYVSNEGGQGEVYVRPFPAGDGRWQVSTAGGVEPRWSHDGRELFYRANTDLYAVPIESAHGFSPGRPEHLFDRTGGGTEIHSYAPDPAGKRFFTFRVPAGQASLRKLYLDLGFARRIAAQESAK